MNFSPFSLNIKGRLHIFSRPAVMGIINLTDDSFHAPSRHREPAEAARAARRMVEAGSDMLDLGAYSSRPGAGDISPAEEMARLCAGVEAVRAEVGSELPLSVDTFRAAVAREAVEVCGADIVNDISGGTLDADMFATVAALRCPYVLMHMRGTPATMQTLTFYGDVAAEVTGYLDKKAAELHALGVADIILDPGFGFAKTLEQNYRLLDSLAAIAALGMPVLAGISRKSMLSRLSPARSVESTVSRTVAAGVLALERGASIIRVHDVADAVDTRAVVEALNTIHA